MNPATDPFLADAFFDTPGLLAVRFARRGGTGTDRSLSAFVAHRRPDTTPLMEAGSFPKVIFMSAVAALFVLPVATRGCAVVEYDSGSHEQPTVVRTLDSAGNSGWSYGLERLGDDLAPRRADLQPWMVRTLLDVPRDLISRGVAPETWLLPRRSDDDARAHQRGRQLADMLANAGAERELAVILDLPGSTSVAAAAGMATHFVPVFTMDNLPHPTGVVPSTQTLEAVVYWRPEFVRARSSHGVDTPAVFVLDGNRLNPYANEVERFDNRSAVRLPDAAGCKALGITRILYVRNTRGNVAERDDLNELFSELIAAGIEIKHLALESLDLAKQVADQPVEKTDEPTRNTSSSSHLWFLRHYAWYRRSDSTWEPSDDPDAAYRAKPRATMFSHHVTPPGFDGGRSQRDSVISRLVPAPRPTTSDQSGAGPPHRTASGSSFRSGSNNSGGSWSRSSSSHSFG